MVDYSTKTIRNDRVKVFKTILQNIMKVVICCIIVLVLPITLIRVRESRPHHPVRTWESSTFPQERYIKLHPPHLPFTQPVCVVWLIEKSSHFKDRCMIIVRNSWYNTRASSVSAISNRKTKFNWRENTRWHYVHLACTEHTYTYLNDVSQHQSVRCNFGILFPIFSGSSDWPSTCFAVINAIMCIEP